MAEVCRRHGINSATFYKQVPLERNWFEPNGDARFPLVVVLGREGGNARHQIVATTGIRDSECILFDR